MREESPQPCPDFADILRPVFGMLSFNYKTPGTRGPPGCKGPPGERGPTCLTAQHRAIISEKVCRAQQDLAILFSDGLIDSALSDVKPSACAFERAYRAKSDGVHAPWVRKSIDGLQEKLGAYVQKEIRVIRTDSKTIAGGFLLVHVVAQYDDALSAVEMITHAADTGVAVLGTYRVCVDTSAPATPTIPLPFDSMELIPFIQTYTTTGRASGFSDAYVLIDDTGDRLTETEVHARYGYDKQNTTPAFAPFFEAALIVLNSFLKDGYQEIGTSKDVIEYQQVRIERYIRIETYLDKLEMLTSQLNLFVESSGTPVNRADQFRIDAIQAGIQSMKAELGLQSVSKSKFADFDFILADWVQENEGTFIAAVKSILVGQRLTPVTTHIYKCDVTDVGHAGVFDQHGLCDQDGKRVETGTITVYCCTAVETTHTTSTTKEDVVRALVISTERVTAQLPTGSDEYQYVTEEPKMTFLSATSFADTLNWERLWPWLNDNPGAALTHLSMQWYYVTTGSLGSEVFVERSYIDSDILARYVEASLTDRVVIGVGKYDSVHGGGPDYSRTFLTVPRVAERARWGATVVTVVFSDAQMLSIHSASARNFPVSVTDVEVDLLDAITRAQAGTNTLAPLPHSADSRI
jgi:hypothetical protein